VRFQYIKNGVPVRGDQKDEVRELLGEVFFSISKDVEEGKAPLWNLVALYLVLLAPSGGSDVISDFEDYFCERFNKPDIHLAVKETLEKTGLRIPYCCRPSEEYIQKTWYDGGESS